MIILENQDERSPLKTEGGTDITTPSAASPPPYVPTLPSNVIVPSYQAVPHSHHVTAPRRQLPIRRLLVTFAIACLVLLLFGVIMYGFYKSVITPFQSRRFTCSSADLFLCSRTDLFINRLIPFRDKYIITPSKSSCH